MQHNVNRSMNLYLAKKRGKVNLAKEKEEKRVKYVEC